MKRKRGRALKTALECHFSKRLFEQLFEGGTLRIILRATNPGKIEDSTPFAPKIGYEVNDASGAAGGGRDNVASCHVHEVVLLSARRPDLTSEKCGLPWTTDASDKFLVYPVPHQHSSYNFVEDLKIKKRAPTLEDKDGRMVLEPKFVDYGSIHPTADVPHQQLQQHNSSHALLSPRSILSLPPLEDEELPNTSKGTNMTQGDLYQRQPLLPATGKSDKWGHHHHNHLHPNGSATHGYYGDDDDEDDVVPSQSDNKNNSGGSDSTNGVIKINMPTPIREEPKFPQERWKTLIASVVMFFNFVLTLTSLSLVHEKLPDREKYGPLPDVFLDNVPAFDWALNVSEYIIIICVNSCIILLIFHKHRFIVFRRIFLIMSLLYMYRAITMYVTVLPVASKTYFCSPKANETSFLLVAKRVIKLMSGFGLSVNGQHVYCGDFIYSGHTVILVLSNLFISEYSPKRLYPLHWLYWALGIVGVVMLQLSHGHYTVDVVIAYFVTTRIFWTYHTLANNASLKQHSANNLLGRAWWFTPFLYFEGNVGGPVPRQLNCPLSLPRKFQSKSRDS